MAGNHPWKSTSGETEFYNANGYVKQEERNGITHHTWFNAQTKRHISYDTSKDRWGEEKYVPGSGHETDHYTGEVVARWG